MSEERARRWIEESQKDTARQSAGHQHVQAAIRAEMAGDMAAMEREYAAAAEAFLQSANEYRASKSYKKAALNMCDAGDVFSEMADASRAIEAYQQGADDLLAASAEHLMWGEDAETSKGTALAMTACMIYIMIGKEAEAFYKARGFAAENASKIRLPAIIQLSQIPQMIESSIQSLNLEAFAAAENAAVTELKSALASSGSSEFSKYVDRGLDMVREILRGKLKVPKISAQLTIPIDLTFTEDFSVRLSIRNSGEGAATNMKIEWHLDEGIHIVSGESAKTIHNLPAGETIDAAIIVRADEGLGGSRDYAIVVRGTYEDKLKTAYSIQAGPTIITLKDYKESEKLLHDSSVTESRVSFLRASIEASEFEPAPLIRVVDGLTSTLKQLKDDIENSELEKAKARLIVVNDIVDQIDALLGDDDLVDTVTKAKEAEKKTYARGKLIPACEEAIAVAANQEKKLESEIPLGLSEWDSIADKKKRILSSAHLIKDTAEALKGKLTTPELQALEASISDIEHEANKIQNDSLLVVGSKPASPEKVEMAMIVARSIRNEITQLMEKKKSELE
ncbi:hypothetical protein EU527_08240 [Candidatus Thorarchaeota archaeon]|nr:MAG: hypothetical protein EU527_08240 [Candidatus Thorarchaeota archaeon]